MEQEQKLRTRISPFKEHKLTLIGDKAMAVFDDTKDWNEKLFIMDYKFGTKKNTLNLEAKQKKFIKVPFRAFKGRMHAFSRNNERQKRKYY